MGTPPNFAAGWSTTALPTCWPSLALRSSAYRHGRVWCSAMSAALSNRSLTHAIGTASRKAWAPKANASLTGCACPLRMPLRVMSVTSSTSLVTVLKSPNASFQCAPPLKSPEKSCWQLLFGLTVVFRMVNTRPPYAFLGSLHLSFLSAKKRENYIPSQVADFTCQTTLFICRFFFARGPRIFSKGESKTDLVQQTSSLLHQIGLFALCVRNVSRLSRGRRRLSEGACSRSTIP